MPSADFLGHPGYFKAGPQEQDCVRISLVLAVGFIWLESKKESDLINRL